MKAFTTKLGIDCSRDFHSFIHETKDLSSRPSRRPKKVESFPVHETFIPHNVHTYWACLCFSIIDWNRKEPREEDQQICFESMAFGAVCMGGGGFVGHLKVSCLCDYDQS
jgi:hypothetical protein